ncbi:MAG: EAL domain-containing protein [Gammaproteobacteria bacterium]|nr:EAL domain-containing protein [Gammaproteobacteria bacterium]
MNNKTHRKKTSLKTVIIVYAVITLIALLSQYSLYTSHSENIINEQDRDARLIDKKSKDLSNVLNNTIPLITLLEELKSVTTLMRIEMQTLKIQKNETSNAFRQHSEELKNIQQQLYSINTSHITEFSKLNTTALVLSQISEKTSGNRTNMDVKILHNDFDRIASELIRTISAVKQSINSSITSSSASIKDDFYLQKNHIEKRKQQESRHKLLYLIQTTTITLLPLIVIYYLISHLYRRIAMIRKYADNIAREKYSLPPFTSTDPTGRLALTLCLIGRKIRSSLQQSRQQTARTRNVQRDTKQIDSFDTLTGLVNRRYFKKILHTAIQSDNNSNYLLFLDLDNFKDINDVMGHDLGDQLLKNISHRIQDALRPDDVVCRMGGDEFSILLYACHNNIKQVLERLLSNINLPFIINNETIRATISIGVVKIKSDLNVETLMKHADLAMYNAKHSGKNTYRFFTDKLEETVVRKQEMLHELRVSLANQEFELFYQPKISLSTNCINGYEALIRWRHPEKGLIPPDDFIPVVEDSEIIHPLGMWILEEACTQSMTLQNHGIMIPVSVNVSPKQFFAKNFLLMIETILTQTKMPPELLELEITESILMDNLDTAITHLNILRSKGIRISIDDFGTGYSSMKYLRDLPVDTMKIDKSFLSNIHNDTKDKEIIKAMAGLGNTLSMEVIAEGIETLQQMNFLKEIGCDTGQGYLFSKPLPFEELKLYIENIKNNKLSPSITEDSSPALYIIKPMT